MAMHTHIHEYARKHTHMQVHAYIYACICMHPIDAMHMPCAYHAHTMHMPYSTCHAHAIQHVPCTYHAHTMHMPYSTCHAHAIQHVPCTYHAHTMHIPYARAASQTRIASVLLRIALTPAGVGELLASWDALRDAEAGESRMCMHVLYVCTCCLRRGTPFVTPRPVMAHVYACTVCMHVPHLCTCVRLVSHASLVS